MTLGQLIDVLRTAIYRQEGMPLDCTNPGNLRDCPWFPGESPLESNGTVISRRKYPTGAPVQYKLTGSGIFWNPTSRALGDAGAAHVIALHIAEGNTLAQLVGCWAPALDGNATAQYVLNVMAWTDINSADAPLANLIDA